MGKLIAAGAVALFVLITALATYFTVGQNEVAVVTRFGKFEYVANPGLHFMVPFMESYSKYRTDIQQLTSEKAVNTYTVDNQEIDILYTIFYSTPSERIPFIFEHNQDFKNRLNSLSIDRIKAAFGKVNVQKVAESRGEIRDSILATLRKDADHLGIEVGDFQLTDLQYNESFRAAVNSAAVQKANIEKFEYQRQQAEKEAETVRIRADGEAQAARSKARGEADARLYQAEAEAKATKLDGEAKADSMKAQGLALAANPMLVEYTKAQRWTGELPKSMLSNVMPFLNVDQHAPVMSAGK